MSAMGGCRRKQAPAVRVIPPGVTGLEIWDCRVRGGVLWDYRNDACFAQVLAEALQAIREGRACSRSEGRISTLAMDFDALYLAGGRLSPHIAEYLKCLHVPVIGAPDPVFAGDVGGRRLLEAHGLCGPVVDVGQSSVKLSFQERRLRLERDWTRLPMRDEVALEHYPVQAVEFCDFVGQGIARFIDGAAGIDALALALPCAIERDARLGGSSYAGMRDNPDLVGALMRVAGLEAAGVLLLNDAELAACSARLDTGLKPFTKTLVVTLGFGVGAALLES